LVFFSAIIIANKSREDERDLAESEEIQEKRKVTILLSLVAGLLVVIVGMVIFYLRANQPMAQAKKEAIAIAEKQANLQNADHFYWFTRKKTYFTVTGKNNQGSEIVVIIPRSGEKVTVLEQKDGLSEAQARETVTKAHPQEAEVIKASLGMYDDQPVWEIMTKNSQKELTYYLVSFTKGETVSGKSKIYRCFN
jgi:uncharacterized protein YpmB